MAISFLSTAGISQYAASASNLNKVNQAWSSLASAVETGNLKSIQTAYSAYDKLNQNLSKLSGSSSTSTQFATDWAALGTAIKSGSLSDVQSAFSTVDQDVANNLSPSLQLAQQAITQGAAWIGELMSSVESSYTPSSSSDASSLFGNSNSSTSTIDPMISILENGYKIQALANGTLSTLQSTNNTTTNNSAS